MIRFRPQHYAQRLSRTCRARAVTDFVQTRSGRALRSETNLIAPLQPLQWLSQDGRIDQPAENAKVRSSAFSNGADTQAISSANVDDFFEGQRTAVDRCI